MGQYGKAAIKAATSVRTKKIIDPVRAWNDAVADVFPNSPSSQSKGCPRGTFLGLCEGGYVLGVLRGDYTKSEKNKSYGIKAVRILKDNPSVSFNKHQLWELVMNGQEKKSNEQMDVVLALWENNLIDRDSI